MLVTGRGILHPKAGENIKRVGKYGLHTSLGEESAETVVGVGLLALLSEESIGLFIVLVAAVYIAGRK